MGDLHTIGVIGAGVMGVGVAQSCAHAGYKVVVIDIDDAILQKAKATIATNLRFHGLMTGGKNIQDVATILGNIHFSKNLSALADCDFLVENVTEKWTIKESVYKDLDKYCPEHCVYAVNTSAISITRIAALTSRADRVIGMHFMNPVPMKPVVETIRAFHTSEQTIAIAENFLQKMGKRMVLVNDSPGFVSNRVLMLTINEAINLLHDGVATSQQVDDIFVSCFGHKMGPLATADLIGLDTILYSIEVLYDSYCEDKYRPSMLLKKMVDAGLHGKKTGQGFYQYGDNHER
jgi:3-hydroxybutyryl-CoA dehydrogenase